MKKVNITTAVLLIYLIVMSIIGWPGKQANPDYVQYFGVIAATVLVIGLLRFLQIKRLKIRDKIKDGKKVSKDRSYLPGYVLIEANLTGEMPHIIENITGVISFLGPKGEAPTPLRQAEVNRILGKVDELADSEEVLNIPFVVGESVKVTDGPFNSFSGVIEE